MFFIIKKPVISTEFCIYNADSLAFIKALPDDSIDLIATDPPYFRVKKCSWDNQWKTEAEYLSWLDEMLLQFWRVLKPAGSLYMFCSSRLVADTEILMRERFKIVNHIIWAKPSGPWNLQNKASMRSFFPATERILFAEHYAGPYKPKDSGYSTKCRELKREVFRPLIDYFRRARLSLKISVKDIDRATCKQMSSHWFSESQWQMPNERDYALLYSLFQRAAAEQGQPSELNKSYTELQMEYQTLNSTFLERQKNYAALKRPFAVSSAYLLPMFGIIPLFRIIRVNTPAKNPPQ